MAQLYEDTKKEKQVYVDRRFGGGQEERKRLLGLSTTLYVGNLSFYTTEEQIYELFRKAGAIRRIVMGLDRHSKTPCGFCFVEYATRSAAQNCLWFITGTKLDHRTIRCDWDAGFSEGRQYGRGRSGGQVRDEYREDYDPDRGGYGKQIGDQTRSGAEMWGDDGAAPSGVGSKRRREDGDEDGAGRRRGGGYGPRGGGRHGRGRGRGNGGGYFRGGGGGGRY